MSTTLQPRESGRLISDTSQDVSINRTGVKKCAEYIYKEIKATGYGLRCWRENILHPQTMDKAAIEWVFVVDSLNFCFWSCDPSKQFYINYRGQKWTGYWSLCAALNRALEAGMPMTDPHYYSCITLEELASMFRCDSGVEIPMLKERLDVLHQVGQILVQKYDGSFTACVEKCCGSAQDLLQLIVSEFPPFRDQTQYNGKTVSFYKRAQILIADVWGCCEGKGLGKFHDIDHLTMFADYRVPQVLVHFGVLEYSEKLLDLLKKDSFMKTGDRLEIEIRGCSIWAIELICEEMKKIKASDCANSNIVINSIIVDQFMWDFRRANAQMLDKIPHHKVFCIFY